MASVLAWLWRHKLAVGLAVAVASSVGLYVAWLDAHDELVRTRAVAEERLADFSASEQKSRTLAKAYRAVVTNTAPELARMDSLRREALRRNTAAEMQARESSIRNVAYGDSLTATLDSAWSLAVKAQAEGTLIHPDELKPVLETARRQHVEERAAQRSLATALHQQLAATQDMLAAADSTTRLWERRYVALDHAYRARGEALREAREAVEAMTVGQEGGWSTVHKLTAGVALLAVGYVAGVGF